MTSWLFFRLPFVHAVALRKVVKKKKAAGEAGIREAYSQKRAELGILPS